MGRKGHLIDGVVVEERDEGWDQYFFPFKLIFRQTETSVIVGTERVQRTLLCNEFKLHNHAATSAYVESINTDL